MCIPEKSANDEHRKSSSEIIQRYKHNNWKNNCYCGKEAPFIHTHDLNTGNPDDIYCFVCDCNMKFESQVIGIQFASNEINIVNKFSCIKRPHNHCQFIPVENISL